MAVLESVQFGSVQRAPCALRASCALFATAAVYKGTVTTCPRPQLILIPSLHFRTLEKTPLGPTPRNLHYSHDSRGFGAAPKTQQQPTLGSAGWNSYMNQASRTFLITPPVMAKSRSDSPTLLVETSVSAPNPEQSLSVTSRLSLVTAKHSGIGAFMGSVIASVLV